MLTSKAHLLGTTLFALFSIYAIFYSLYQTQLKFDDASDLNLLSQDNSTWFQPKVKVVMIIIDGLRFDYLLNYENIDHDPYLQANKFNKFNKAYFDNPDKFVVVRAKADLPTMTVLRVPCLMTGNVPRLGSVLTAFGALPSIEDSAPRQLYLHDKKSYFSGDPILHEYFPKYLESDFQLGAFNVRDKRADAPSQAYISEKIAENKFDFLVAHFLRLDHAGHHRDLYWEGVRRAIDDIDQYLIHIMENIDDNTMLIFGGDHGMVKEGSHGGGTPQETNTALVAYYKKGFMKNMYKNKDFKKIMRSINETKDQVHQIDIAPTLSMLMGLPTPFSNMGQILNDMYPVGDYLPPSQQECPETAFLMQMLHDNHLNTLQVWKYFKKYHEGQSLFKHKEYSKISNLFEKAQAHYNNAQEMIDQSQQCTDSFQKIALKAIKNSQKLSNHIHDLVSTKSPRDLVIFWQGFLILVLACASYVLQIQFIYDTKDYEYITLLTKLKNWKAELKFLIPILLILTLIWTLTLANNPQMMRPITSSVLFLALYILGFSIVSFLSKPRDAIATSPTTATSEENQRLPFSLKNSFILQNPRITAGAFAIIGLLFYLTHELRIDTDDLEDLNSYDPYICVMLIACRISSRYQQISRSILAIAAILCVTLRFIDVYDYWYSEINVIMGFVFLGDWLYNETQFSIQKLKAGKVWSYQYVICFTVLIFYHLILGSRTDLVQIYLPRVIWLVIIASILASFALKMPRKTIKRNMQVNLVLFLSLMQMHKKFVYFTIVLSIYRIVTYFFKRAQFKNYLYTLIMGFISYIGILYIGFGDRNLPRDFGPAFVGLKDFHLGLCLLLYGSAFLSTIILGMLFMSFYSQDLELQEVELGVQKEETDCQVVALKGHSKIIRKRNIIMYCFFYNVLMIGAAINPIILKNHKKIGLSMERFLADGIFYLFTINILYFVF